MAGDDLYRALAEELANVENADVEVVSLSAVDPPGVECVQGVDIAQPRH